MKTTKLFVNNNYRIISNNENYCFENELELTGGYLTMYPIENSDIIQYLNDGYSLIINDEVVL